MVARLVGAIWQLVFAIMGHALVHLRFTCSRLLITLP